MNKNISILEAAESRLDEEDKVSAILFYFFILF